MSNINMHEKQQYFGASLYGLSIVDCPSGII
jgi:hypothetical protein